jgi:plastocyanin
MISTRAWHRTSSIQTALWRLAAVSAVLTVLGCGDTTPAPTRPAAPRDATHLYWALSLDHHAITLSTAAPYDTLQLTATALDAQGTALDGLDGTVSFRSTVPDVAYVTADGLVHAMKAGTGVQVIAEYATGNARHADTAIVNVTNDTPAPRMLDSLSIHPLPPAEATVNFAPSFQFPETPPPSISGYLQSLAFSVFFGSTITARATDMAGHAIPKIAVAFTSANPLVATINRSTGAIKLVSPGQVPIIATATAYGVTKADTVVYTVLQPIFAALNIKRRPISPTETAVTFGPSEVTVSAGAMVLWLNTSGEPVDVTFDDPTNVAPGTIGCGEGDPGEAGNIAAFGEPLDPDPTVPLSGANCRTRSFPVPGTYAYHSTATGAAGRIIVAGGPSNP